MPELEPQLSEKVVALRDALEASSIPYAFGGAIALYYFRDPRSTTDIDVNIFLPPDQTEDVGQVLGSVYRLDVERLTDAVTRDGQSRTSWDSTFVDLFFADTEFHEAMSRRTLRKPFLDTEINVLSPEDLLVCKMLFDRPKDWIDVEAVARGGHVMLDNGYIEAALDNFVDRSDPRFEHWRSMSDG